MSSKRRAGRPRTKPAEERRNDLLDAAQRLFLDQGFGPTTVDQITRAAGVAKGTYYLYFTTKDDIRDALAERLAHRQLDFIKRAVAAAPEHPLEAWAEACIAFRLDTAEELADGPAVDHLAGLLAPLSQEPRALAVFLFNGVHALIDDARAREHPLDRDCLSRQVKAFCARLTAGAPPSPPLPRSAPAKPKPPEQRQGSLF